MIAVLPSMIHPQTAVLGRAGGGQFGCPPNRSRGNPKIGLGIW